MGDRVRRSSPSHSPSQSSYASDASHASYTSSHTADSAHASSYAAADSADGGTRTRSDDTMKVRRGKRQCRHVLWEIANRRIRVIQILKHKV